MCALSWRGACLYLAVVKEGLNLCLRYFSVFSKTRTVLDTGTCRSPWQQSSGKRVLAGAGPWAW